ncbi:dephospho-CoA kinase [Methyloligella sp. 2.7D]|uniref:dephospho-CoA kinase n=1 Tax=unclassified Methyloligella TaxID=2625955 RepID=UPI00157D46CC|nr:dephospho-CoA kinase [Methyloligella sp. GL2]QKP76278.1 dephospho-CoA kinase [Methyloligella sp. GL2]
MLIIGLTGSIGMGKTTTAACFAKRGVPVLDADAEVHRLYEGAAVPLIEAAFPGTTEEGKVDRARLAEAISGAPEKLKALEEIVHPLVLRAEFAFLEKQEKAGTEIALLEIPLLFEAGAQTRVDVTVVVSAPADAQRERVLSRPGMSEEKFNALLARQLLDAAKRERADFVIDTGGSLEAVQEQVDAILEQVKSRQGLAMESLRAMLASPD